MTECGYCSDCRFWGKDEKQLAPERHVLGECTHPNWRCWVPQGSVSDNLTTESDFGCVQFEAK